jgi:hypothetical protein
MKGNLLRGLTSKLDERKEEESKFLDPKTTKFSYENLKGKFPDGIDPTRKEAYLSDEEFNKVFGMPKEKFYELKKWKQ